MTVDSDGRRDFLRKSAYVAPAILTLQAYSSMAKAGSVKEDDCEPEDDRYRRRRRRR